MIDWTNVIVAAIAATPPTVLALLNRRSLRTPSGDPIGHVVERTHDLAAVTTAAVTKAVLSDAAVAKAVDRIGNGEDAA